MQVKRNSNQPLTCGGAAQRAEREQNRCLLNIIGIYRELFFFSSSVYLIKRNDFKRASQQDMSGLALVYECIKVRIDVR